MNQAQKIINEHIEHRRQERQENPERFNIHPSIGDASFRRPLHAQEEPGQVPDQARNEEPERSKSLL